MLCACVCVCWLWTISLEQIKFGLNPAAQLLQSHLKNGAKFVIDPLTNVSPYLSWMLRAWAAKLFLWIDSLWISLLVLPSVRICRHRWLSGLSKRLFSCLLRYLSGIRKQRPTLAADFFFCLLSGSLFWKHLFCCTGFTLASKAKWKFEKKTALLSHTFWSAKVLKSQ